MAFQKGKKISFERLAIQILCSFEVPHPVVFRKAINDLTYLFR